MAYGQPWLRKVTPSDLVCHTIPKMLDSRTITGVLRSFPLTNLSLPLIFRGCGPFLSQSVFLLVHLKYSVKSVLILPVDVALLQEHCLTNDNSDQLSPVGTPATYVFCGERSSCRVNSPIPIDLCDLVSILSQPFFTNHSLFYILAKVNYLCSFN